MQGKRKNQQMWQGKGVHNDMRPKVNAQTKGTFTFFSFLQRMGGHAQSGCKHKDEYGGCWRTWT